ncbi:MAG: DegV family EDD domain-containing protein [Anaerolineaceae bacterium]|nr:DegV family EDD domain-containing protein [Anaerolineaceae bacterium]
MHSIGIITDSSAQFAQPVFPGRDRVRVIPFDIKIGQELYIEGKGLKSACFSPFADDENHPILPLPTIDKISDQLMELTTVFDQVLILTLSSKLSPLFDLYAKAATLIKGRSRMHLIDSMTTSGGLGFLVQKAAEAAANGQTVVQIEQYLRLQIPHIYSLFCPQSLSYLFYSGYIDRAQAAVGEILGLYPIFTLEEGKLTSIEKQRNIRSTMDFFQEFVDEFSDVTNVAFLQSCPPSPQESKLIRQHLEENFPDAIYNEHAINPTLSCFFGPKTLGLTVIENPND